MKLKFILLVTILGLTNSLILGQQTLDLVSGQLTDSILKTIPYRDIIEEENSVIVTYNFHHAVMQTDPQGKGSKLVKIEGFGLSDCPGNPSLLGRVDLFIVPDGKKAKLKILEAKFTDFDLVLSPAHPATTDDDENAMDSIPEILSYEGFRPIEILSLRAPESYRSINTQKVAVYPIQYDYQNHKLRAYTTIKYQLCFDAEENANSDIRLTLSKNDNTLKNIALNPSQINRLPNPTFPTETYLILSTPEFRSAVSIYEQWKRIYGFRTRSVYNSNWTPELIQSTINSEAATNPDLYYILIVGNHDDVPGVMEYFVDHGNRRVHFATDYYYSCLNGAYKDLPDFNIGRITADNLQEANDIFCKIINYERYPTTDSTFYQKGINCAYFDDSPPDTYADSRYAQTSEEIRDYLIGQGKTIQRIYYANPNVDPQYWNNGTFSYGEEIPNDLKKPLFAWDGDADDITNAINNGAFYILHRDHGEEWGWYSPRYEKSELENLHNNNGKLPLVFSMNCLTGYYYVNTPCFSRVFLRKPEFGCVGIYASTHRSYTTYNDVLTCGIFDAIWPYPGLRPAFPAMNYPPYYSISPILEMGRILKLGLARMDGLQCDTTTQLKELTHKMYHFFGDPGTIFRNETPTQFAGVTITRNPILGKISVTIPQGAERIVFNENLTNNITVLSGNTATYTCQDINQINICISSHNKIPYIEERLNFGPVTPNFTGRNSITQIQSMGKTKIISVSLSPETLSANLNLTSLDGIVVFSQSCNKTKTTLSMHLDALPEGIYICTLEVEGQICDNSKIIINP